MDVNAKGAQYEREIAHYLQDHGFPAAKRTAQLVGKNGGEPDVKGLPGLHLECKRQERYRINDWYQQACDDASYHGTIPTVIYRQSRKPSMITMSLDDFMAILKAAYISYPDGDFPTVQ